MTTDEARDYAKGWLNRGRALNYELKQLTEYRKSILEALGGGVASYSPKEIQTDTVSAQAKADDLRLAYSETCEKIERRFTEFAKINNTTLDYINELEDADERTLLTGRHVNFKPWGKLYRELHLGRATAFRHYNVALDNIFKVLYRNNDDFRYFVDVENTNKIAN